MLRTAKALVPPIWTPRPDKTRGGVFGDCPKKAKGLPAAMTTGTTADTERPAIHHQDREGLRGPCPQPPKAFGEPGAAIWEVRSKTRRVPSYTPVAVRSPSPILCQIGRTDLHFQRSEGLVTAVAERPPEKFAKVQIPPPQPAHALVIPLARRRPLNRARPMLGLRLHRLEGFGRGPRHRNGRSTKDLPEAPPEAMPPTLALPGAPSALDRPH
jgi:hypothetical protein